MDGSLHGSLSEEMRRDIFSEARRRSFSRRDILFLEGDASDGMYLITSGCIAVRMTTPSGDVATLAVVGADESLGEQSLLEHGTRRSTSALALNAVETYYLSRDHFDAMRRRDPSVNRILTSLFDDRLRRVSARLLEALYTPAPQRVIRRVIELAVQFEPEDVIPLTQEDIADLAGTTRPTVNRALRQAETIGAVRLSRGTVQLLDMAALGRLAG